mgnify:CR=1 FL=1
MKESSIWYGILWLKSILTSSDQVDQKRSLSTLFFNYKPKYIYPRQNIPDIKGPVLNYGELNNQVRALRFTSSPKLEHRRKTLNNKFWSEVSRSIWEKFYQLKRWFKWRTNYKLILRKINWKLMKCFRQHRGDFFEWSVPLVLLILYL